MARTKATHDALRGLGIGGGIFAGGLGGGMLGQKLGEKFTPDKNKQGLIALLSMLAGGTLGGYAGHKLTESDDVEPMDRDLAYDVLGEAASYGAPVNVSELSPAEVAFLKRYGREQFGKRMPKLISKKGSVMDRDVAFELGSLLAEHAHGTTKAAECPGGRKRSKGRGRGLGIGKGKGPIGRATAIKYGWKPPKEASAVDVKVERMNGSEKKAWVGAAINAALLGAQFAPMIYNWFKGGSAPAAGAAGAAGAPRPTPAFAASQAPRMTMPRRAATPAYSYGRGLKFASAAKHLVKAALIGNPYMSGAAAPPEVPSAFARNPYMHPAALGAAAPQESGPPIAEMLTAGALMGANPNYASMGKKLSAKAPVAAAPKAMLSAQQAAKAMSANPNYARMAAGAAGAAKLPFWKRPISLGKIGKYGGIAALLGLALPSIYKGVKGAWQGITGAKPSPFGDSSTDPAFSAGEERQFARYGINPKRFRESMDASNAMRIAAEFRRSQMQNWMNAARASMMTGGLQ